MLKNRLIYLTVSTCTPLIIMRTLQRKLIVKINSMKGKNLSIMAMIAAVFCSCGQQPAQERGPRPVKLAEVTSLSRIEKSYSGVVSPDQFSDLAFKMSGPLVAMNVLEGQRVKKGQVVAEIDPTDYKLDYDAKRASFQKAASQMQRAEKLLAKNAISMQEFETTQASYTNAKSAFENAQNTLNDTKLRAPFDGFIQKKYVENYQRVQPGQGVVCLINPAKLQVEFTIPETNISYVTSPSTIYVEFDAYKGKLFQEKVKEYVEASPDGAGVPVFLYIDDPEFDLKKYKVSVGFSCRVIVNIENDVVKEGITVPLSAVVFDNNLNSKIVFIYNPSTQKVELRKVSDDTLVGSAPDITKHFIELRGIGIVDVKALFGALSVKDTQTIDLVIRLEDWDKDKEYDRLGLEENYTEYLGNKVVCHNIPIRPGRNLAVICETAAINHRQKKMGYNAAKELYTRVQNSLAKRREEDEDDE